MKQCNKCKKLKNKSEFGKNRTCKDGLSLWCKKCSCEYNRRRYRRIRGPVKKHFSYEESHRTINSVKQKRCTKCKKLKYESVFSKNRNNKDGLRFWCKKCEREYKRRYYKRNRGPAKYLRYEKRHRIVNRVKQKRCSRCKKWKAEREFYKDRLRKDGLKFRCKECSKKANRKSHKKRRLAVMN